MSSFRQKNWLKKTWSSTKFTRINFEDDFLTGASKNSGPTLTVPKSLIYDMVKAP